MLESVVRGFVKFLSFFINIDSTMEYADVVQRLKEGFYFNFEVFLMGVFVIIFIGYLALVVKDRK